MSELSPVEARHLDRQSAALESIAATLKAILALLEEKAKQPKTLPIR